MKFIEGMKDMVNTNENISDFDFFFQLICEQKDLDM